MRTYIRGRLKAQWRRHHCHIHIILLATMSYEWMMSGCWWGGCYWKWEFLCRENETCEYHSELSMQWVNSETSAPPWRNFFSRRHFWIFLQFLTDVSLEKIFKTPIGAIWCHFQFFGASFILWIFLNKNQVLKYK